MMEWEGQQPERASGVDEAVGGLERTDGGDSRTMTKADLVDEVARVAELAKKDAQVIVETVFDNIVEALKNGDGIELRGFGSFRFRHRGQRRGRNPKTGTPVDIPAKRTPYFKPGKALKEIINQE